jgi:ACT domain-containing protein
MNDDSRITSAVDYPVCNLNLCTILESHEGMVDSECNLIATVNHKLSKKNDGHYTAVNKSPTLRSWYKYDDDIVNLVKFVKGNTKSLLMDFQKTASILFYINVRYVYVCHNNLHINDEVIERTGHKHPLIIDQLQDATSSLPSSNTLSFVLKLHLVIVVEQQLIQIFDIC